jgi:hypothetical protein
LKLNGTRLLRAYVDDVNVLGDNTNVINKNTEPVIDAIKAVGLEVNAVKTKCMLLPGHQNAGKNHYIKIGSRSFETAAQFKYLGTTV